MFAVCCTINLAFTQIRTPNKKITLRSINTVGLLNGSTGPSLSLQTILGASVYQSFAGIGIGLDYYRFRSIPVFADLRYEFGKASRTIFVYGDLGYNYDWLTEKNKQDIFFSSSSNYRGGVYYDVGIGYKIGFKNRDALLLSTGYTYKRIKNKAGTGVCPIAGPCFEEVQTYIFSMPRIVIRMGWRF